MKKNQPRILAAFLTGIYFLSNVALCSAAESNFWAERRRSQDQSANAAPVQLASLPAGFTLPAIQTSVISSPSTLPQLRNRVAKPTGDVLKSIPYNNATLKDVNLPDSALAPVVLVQDVHLNFEAQKNIAEVLQSLIKDHRIAAVGVEGAFDRFDFSQFRAFPDKSIIKDVSDELLKQNMMAAPSYAGIVSADEPPTFVGVDDKTHHQANIDAYLASTKVKSAVLQKISAEKIALNQQKADVFSLELLNFETLRAQERAGKIGYGVYIKKLAAISGEDALPLDVRQFKEAYDLETTLDFARVESEKKQIIGQLAEKLNQDSVKTLLAESIAYKSGQMSTGAFYQWLNKFCIQNHVALGKTPSFQKFIHYSLLADGISMERLLDGVEELEASILNDLIRSPKERELIGELDRVSLQEKIANYELTPKEWETYKKAKSNTKHEELGTLLKPFERFYEEADARSHTMLGKLLEENNLNGGALVMVTGGFHTPQITALLKEKNRPYIVISPKITKVEDGAGSAYLSIFERDKTPLDRLFAGEKLTLNSPDGAVGSKSSVGAARNAWVMKIFLGGLTALAGAALPSNVKAAQVKPGIVKVIAQGSSTEVYVGQKEGADKNLQVVPGTEILSVRGNNILTKKNISSPWISAMLMFLAGAWAAVTLTFKRPASTHPLLKDYNSLDDTNESKRQAFANELQENLSVGAKAIISETKKRLTLNDTDELSLLLSVAIYILDQGASNFSVRDLRILDQKLATYKKQLNKKGKTASIAHYLSTPTLFLLALSPYVPAGEPEDAYIRMSKELPNLPGEYGVRATALDLFLTGIHLNGVATQTEYGDIKTILKSIEHALRQLNNPALSTSLRQALLRSIGMALYGTGRMEGIMVGFRDYLWNSKLSEDREFQQLGLEFRKLIFDQENGGFLAKTLVKEAITLFASENISQENSSWAAQQWFFFWHFYSNLPAWNNSYGTLENLMLNQAPQAEENFQKALREKLAGRVIGNTRDRIETSLRRNPFIVNGRFKTLLDDLGLDESDLAATETSATHAASPGAWAVLFHPLVYLPLRFLRVSDQWAMRITSGIAAITESAIATLLILADQRECAYIFAFIAINAGMHLSVFVRNGEWRISSYSLIEKRGMRSFIRSYYSSLIISYLSFVLGLAALGFFNVRSAPLLLGIMALPHIILNLLAVESGSKNAIGKTLHKLRLRILFWLDPQRNIRHEEAVKIALEANEKADYDLATGLLSRHLLASYAKPVYKDGEIKDYIAPEEFSFIFFDVFNFGNVNTVTNNREIGDRLALQVAAALERAVKIVKDEEIDKQNGNGETPLEIGIFRYGGDEFTISAPTHLAQRIMEEATKQFGTYLISAEAGNNPENIVAIGGAIANKLSDADVTSSLVKLQLKPQLAKTINVEEHIKNKRLVTDLTEDLIRRRGIVLTPELFTKLNKFKISGWRWALADLLDPRYGVELEIQGKRMSEAYKKAFIDPITGFYNEASLKSFQRSMQGTTREQKFAVYMTKLNEFKYINKQKGHSVGDTFLKLWAKMIQTVTHKYGIKDRYVFRPYGSTVIVYVPLDLVQSRKKKIMDFIVALSQDQQHLYASSLYRKLITLDGVHPETGLPLNFGIISSLGGTFKEAEFRLKGNEQKTRRASWPDHAAYQTRTRGGMIPALFDWVVRRGNSEIDAQVWIVPVIETLLFGLPQFVLAAALHQLGGNESSNLITYAILSFTIQFGFVASHHLFSGSIKPSLPHIVTVALLHIGLGGILLYTPVQWEWHVVLVIALTALTAISMIHGLIVNAKKSKGETGDTEDILDSPELIRIFGQPGARKRINSDTMNEEKVRKDSERGSGIDHWAFGEKLPVHFEWTGKGEPPYDVANERENLKKLLAELIQSEGQDLSHLTVQRSARLDDFSATKFWRAEMWKILTGKEDKTKKKFAGSLNGLYAVTKKEKPHNWIFEFLGGSDQQRIIQSIEKSLNRLGVSPNIDSGFVVEDPSMKAAVRKYFGETYHEREVRLYTRAEAATLGELIKNAAIDKDNQKYSEFKFIFHKDFGNMPDFLSNTGLVKTDRIKLYTLIMNGLNPVAVEVAANQLGDLLNLTRRYATQA